MSRFADPTAVDTLTLPGGCQCPGTPHTEDHWTYRTELGEGEEKRSGAYGWSSTNGEYFDWEAARDKLVEIASVRWNLVDAAGDPVPLRVATVKLLDEPTRDLMARTIDAAVEASRKPPPNASGAPSRDTSRGARGRTRTAKKAR